MNVLLGIDGRKIRARRKEKGWTQIELAAKVGVKQAYICRLETGLRESPSLETIGKLAAALGIPAAVLLKDHVAERVYRRRKRRIVARHTL